MLCSSSPTAFAMTAWAARQPAIQLQGPEADALSLATPACNSRAPCREALATAFSRR
jgi:hypothetical protein